MLILRSQLLLLTLFVSVTVFAETDSGPTRFSSGEDRVALIELFTSEGCSSCPPADRWLSNLKQDARLWKDFVPIALHVDYWNYIGWQDRFARSEYSSRQRRYIEQGGARVVYTPGFFRDGREWQGWRVGKSAEGARSKAGSLDVVVDGQDIAVRFTNGDKAYSKITVHVAVLGMNLETRVREGENEGKTLRHDFVALGVTSAPLETTSDGYKAVAHLPKLSIQPRDRALVAWVSEAGTEAPIQSVGGYLPQL